MDIEKGHKGFIVHLRDGRTIKEDEEINGVVHDWKEIKRISNNLQDVTAVQIKRGEVYHTLSVDGKNLELLQLKSNVLNLMSGEDNLVERVLGFLIEDEKGEPQYAVKLRIGEKTGGTLLTVEKRMLVEGKIKWVKL